MNRPYVLLSVATSLDGHIDDAGPQRLILSNAADLDRVDAERAAADAVLVGAATIAADDPRLLVRSEVRRAERVARGAPPSPIKVTITRTGRGLDPRARFFTAGDGAKLVYAPPDAVADVEARLDGVATVVPAADLPSALADLADRGVGRLMVEGGTRTTTAFLTAGLVDELQVVVAPLIVGDPAAPRLAAAPAARMRLAEVRQVGDCALLIYR
jgi:5-amino-6-(5-phosphoribosylamino)uracil reductase